MTFIDQIVRSIDARLEELHGEIDTLTQARDQLAAVTATVATAARPRPRRSSRPAKRASSDGAVSSEVLHRLLAEEGDGLSTAELGERAKVDPAHLLPRLRELEAAGRIRRTGHKRSTRWHAVASEQEWIEQRAEELAARSRPA